MLCLLVELKLKFDPQRSTLYHVAGFRMKISMIKTNIAKIRPEEGQTDYLNVRKKPKFFL